MEFRNLTLGLLVSVIALACQPSHDGSNSDPTPKLQANSSALTLFVDGADALSGHPNLYELGFEFPGHESLTVKRRGDLPSQSGLITEGALPDATGVKLTADLFRDRFTPETRTHSCRAKDNSLLELVRDQTASITLTCVPLVSSNTVDPVEVFLAVSKVSVGLQEGEAASRLGERDWSKPALFTRIDTQGRRVSLRGTPNHIVFHVGGEISYSLFSTDPQANLLKALLLGETLKLDPVDGKQIQAFQDAAALKLTGPLLQLQVGGAVPRFILPLSLTTTDSSAKITGSLVEEQAGNEFTVVTYNGENLFDQVDEDRNSTYDDYRIAPNVGGASSNYGQPVLFEGQMMSFTEVKLRGVKRALLGIDPLGPEIVAMQEVESEQIMRDLLTLMSPLGYVTSEFSGWVPGEAPNAIGTGILSKYPIRSKSLLSVPYPAGFPVPANAEPIRPIFKVVLNIYGKSMTLYIGHWRSQAAPESLRKATAEVIEADLAREFLTNPMLDYLILGDLNSAYNENRVISTQSNNTNGQTGINSVLRAQGDERLMLLDSPAKYNFHYELNQFMRQTHYDTRYGWACFDHLIGGNGLYDQKNITYIDNTFTVPSLFNRNLSFLFEPDGSTKRWKSKRVGNMTTHQVGGFSDHVPVYARFFLPVRQSTNRIQLVDPSTPDALDHF